MEHYFVSDSRATKCDNFYLSYLSYFTLEAYFERGKVMKGLLRKGACETNVEMREMWKYRNSAKRGNKMEGAVNLPDFSDAYNM